MFKRNRKAALKVARVSCYGKKKKTRKKNLKRYLKNLTHMIDINRSTIREAEPENYSFYLYLVQTLCSEQIKLRRMNKERYKNTV
jgi:hypothetical protein